MYERIGVSDIVCGIVFRGDVEVRLGGEGNADVRVEVVRLRRRGSARAP